MGTIFGLLVGLASFVGGIVVIDQGDGALGLLVIFGGLAGAVVDHPDQRGGRPREVRLGLGRSSSAASPRACA